MSLFYQIGACKTFYIIHNFVLHWIFFVSIQYTASSLKLIQLFKWNFNNHFGFFELIFFNVSLHHDQRHHTIRNCNRPYKIYVPPAELMISVSNQVITKNGFSLKSVIVWNAFYWKSDDSNVLRFCFKINIL